MKINLQCNDLTNFYFSAFAGELFTISFELFHIYYEFYLRKQKLQTVVGIPTSVKPPHVVE